MVILYHMNLKIVRLFLPVTVTKFEPREMPMSLCIYVTVGWGEYGTTGVKTAPVYLSHGSPERDKFILKVVLKIKIKGTL